MQSSRPRLAFGALLLLALFKLVLHVATSRGYGLFRDELYYIASTDHLAWGYVDHPPLSIAVLALIRGGLGDSLLALRILPALAGAATVFAAGSIAREFGGGTRAQVLAALSATCMATYLAMAHFYSMNAFEILFWAALCWTAARILGGDWPQGWLLFGAIAGFGLQNKVSVAFFAAAFVGGLALSPARRHFAKPQLWFGGLIAVAIFAPHLFWQAQNDWPLLEFQANARANKNLALAPLEFASQQVLTSNPILLPVWGTGVLALLFHHRLRAFRALAMVYPLLFLLFVTQSAKSYYLAPLYTLLFAAGAVALEKWLNRSRLVFAATVGVVCLGTLPVLPMALPVLSVEGFIEHSRRLGLETPSFERHEVGVLPQQFADMHGWHELVDAVESAYLSLPEEERRSARVLAENYGEAGAIDVLGRERGLPRAISGHNAYYHWLPVSLEGPLISVRFSKEELEAWFESVERVGTVECDYCMPFENNSPIHISRGLKIPPAELWEQIRRFQ